MRAGNQIETIMEKPLRPQDSPGYRWAALSGKTNIGTFSCFKDAADARDSMVNRVRVFKPRADIRFF